MNTDRPRVSVVIPAYNQAGYLPAAIQSVLDQTCSDWELIVVDDESTDSTAQVVEWFPDRRIHYVHQKNKGLPGARNTGILHSSGEYLAFLDADDAFHPQKLEIQLAHLAQSPTVGLSYASRILTGQDGHPFWFVRAPAQVAMQDLVLGFPFTINDILVRRSWVERVGAFDESFRLHSEDRDFYLRLALEGCRFAALDSFVSFRRLHAGRRFDRIPERIAKMREALDTAFDDPRCPAEVLALREKAYAIVSLTWACQELAQGDGVSGLAHLREAARLNPSILDDRGQGLANFLLPFSVGDGGDHEAVVQQMFDSLEKGRLPLAPEDLAALRLSVLGRGYLRRGVRELLWGRFERGDALLARAVSLGAHPDEPFLRLVSDQLISFEQFAGAEKASQARHNLVRHLKAAGLDTRLRWFESLHAVNQAFQYFEQRQYRKVPGSILRIAVLDPPQLMNRGLLAVLARSALGVFGREAAKSA